MDQKRGMHNSMAIFASRPQKYDNENTAGPERQMTSRKETCPI